MAGLEDGSLSTEDSSIPRARYPATVGLGYGLGSLISGGIYSRSGATSVFGWAFAVVACGWAASTAAYAALDGGWAGRPSGRQGYRRVELAPRGGREVADPGERVVTPR